MKITIEAEQSESTELWTVRRFALTGQAATLPKALDIWCYHLEIAGVRNYLASKNEIPALKTGLFAKR
jgi:hypothetical protein